MAKKTAPKDAPVKSIRDRITDGYYFTKLPYVERSVNPVAWQAYNADQARLMAALKADMLAEHACTGDPTAVALVNATAVAVWTALMGLPMASC